MAFSKELQKDFQRVIARGRLSHGYIFFGESSDDLLRMAVELANFLETKRWEEPRQTLLDVFVLGEEADAGIDAARSIIRFLSHMPVRSSRRTYIIHRAERLTVHAQHAILKVAEEPPEHSLVLVTVRDPGALLPTLASRFQKIFMGCERQRGARVIDGRAGASKNSDAKAYALEILRVETVRERTELLKALLDSEAPLEAFVEEILRQLREKPLAHWRTLRAVLKRWTAMNQYNTNRKLQLEAALMRNPKS
jgi:hypothetical protein